MYDKYSAAALTAKDTRASLRELKSVARRLEAYQVGPQAANLIAPYQEELNHYTAAGYAVDELKPGNVLASMSVWELYSAGECLPLFGPRVWRKQGLAAIPKPSN